jgi:glyoxylase-like metal-dependent hydrolase (beta-lactamase superfamily II)
MPRRLLVSVASLLLSAAPAFAQDQDFSKVEVKTVPVAGSVSMLQGSGGNIAVLVGPEGVLVVDDEYAPLVPKILTAIGKLSSKPVRFVVNTHWHGDHTGGNAGLGAEGAVIVAQDNVRKRMSTEQFNAFFKRTTPPSPAIALPIVTFAEGVRFYLDGEDIEVTHIGPGHTDGDSTVWFHKANVIHLGDNFFNGLYPFIDGASGGSIDGTVTALEGVLGRIDDQTKVIPGHGPLGTKADLKRFHDMLATVRDRVRQAIRDGKTQDQVLAMKPSAEFDAVWGGGFLKPNDFVTLVYVLLKH